MARTIQENGIQAADQTVTTRTFQANAENRIDLPSADMIADAKMTREGDNLILETTNGEVAIVEGYFNADPAPILYSPDGSALTPNLVQSFVHSSMEFAANETSSDQSPVGAVEEVKGQATVTRADGTVETVTNGTPIYQGDVVETDATGAVNIVFMDETSMSVSANARLAIDEYTYDPSTESGTTNFSVLRGLFVFTSGLIGRDDPDDVKIDTPVGSIGIRGTIIAGEINPGGESNISVLEGAIVIKNGIGEITLSEQFETVRLSGFDQPMKDMGVVPASEINTRFNSIGDVNPSLFTTISDTAREQSTAPASEAPKMDVAPEPTSLNEQSTPSEQQAENNAPIQSSDPVAAPPTPAPDVFASIDSSVPDFDTSSSSGLPSVGTIIGQTSTGLGSATTTTGTPLSSASTGAPSPVTTPPPVTASAETPSIPATTTPPSVLGTAPVLQAPILPFTTVTGGIINDISAAGTLIRTIDTGKAGTIYAISNDPNNYYQLTMNGTAAEIRLSTQGAQALGASLDAVALGGFTLTATLGNDTNTRAFGVLVNDANAFRSFDLDGALPRVAQITDNFEFAGNGNNFGYSITALGDVNNDGFDDFMVGNNTTNTSQNHTYLFNGSAPQITSGNLSGLTTTIATHITTGDHDQTAVAGIGDFDGDGFEDYVVGQYNAGAGGNGSAAIVSGQNPNTQFLNMGTVPAGADAGYSVDGVGDFNNDGYADVIIGMPGTSSGNGAIRFVAGFDTSWTGNFTGTQINGATSSSFGHSLTGLGDFNGDGYSDFAVGAPTYNDGGTTGAGKVAIYAGNAAGVPGAPVNAYVGPAANAGYGTDLFSLGDINGDGKTDLMIGDGKSGHVVFGTNITGAGAPSVSFDVGSYTVTGGGGIGDFNGDGYDDFTISLADSTSTHSYIVFGKDFANETLGLDFFKNPTNALEFKYSGADDSNGLEMNAIGDINGDGYDDFAMGVPDGNGAVQGNGGIMVFYGRDTGAVTGGVVANGTGQALVGNSNNDVLSDGGFDNVSMRGGAGRDIFNISSTNFMGIDGGGNLNGSGSSDYDYMRVVGASNNLDFSSVDFEKISGIEAIHLFNNNQTVTLSVENIFNLLKTSDDGIFRVANDGSGNSLVLTNGTGGDDFTGTITSDIETLLGPTASYENTTMESGNTYNTFKIGGYTLMIDQTLTVDAQ